MKNPYQAYHKATHTVSKTRQVVMLYEGILRNISQAREAIEQNNIPQRYNKLVKASEIIIGLQMSLDFDSGQDSAQALYDFYAQLDTRIMQLQRSQSLEQCDALIEEVRGMHDIWVKIDRGEIDATGQAPAATNGSAMPAASFSQPSEKPTPPAPENITFSA